MLKEDTNYWVTYVNKGSTVLWAVFQHYVFNQNLYEEYLDLPEGLPLPQITKPVMPCAFVADESFLISNYFMGSRQQELSIIKQRIKY